MNPGDSVAPQRNTSFSEINPRLQLFWDSTSLGALKTCPRYYQFTIMQGWTPRQTSCHLTFGAHYHSALEHYDHARFSGESHESATDFALKHVLEVTWNRELNKPWISDDAYKNRWTLVRTVLWYLEEFKHDTLKTVKLANGKPAVELSFRFETSYRSPTGEPYLLCGHLDRVATLGEDTYIVDRKTSKSAIDERFMASFTPDNQFTLYALAGQVVYQLPIKGLIVDGAQIGVGFSRFGRGFANRTKEMLEEWYSELPYWLRQAEHYAETGVYPANEKSCGNYAGCPFRSICSKPPKMREQWLKAGFAKRVWDPRQTRGNI